MQGRQALHPSSATSAPRARQPKRRAARPSGDIPWRKIWYVLDGREHGLTAWMHSRAPRARRVSDIGENRTRLMSRTWKTRRSSSKRGATSQDRQLSPGLRLLAKRRRRSSWHALEHIDSSSSRSTDNYFFDLACSKTRRRLRL